MMRRNAITTAYTMLAASSLLAVTAPARAETFRYSLASQQEFGARRGFKLLFEDGTSEQPRKLPTLRLLLGIGDGKAWRYPQVKADWQWDRDYRIKAVIGEKSADIWLDGELVVRSPGAFVPARDLDTLKAGLDTRNMLGTTDYLVQQTALSVTTTKGQTRTYAFASPQERTLPLYAFEPQTPINGPFRLADGEYVTIEAAFRILRAPDLRAVSPMVDRYGQARHADWPDKVRDRQDLERAREEEKRRHAAWGLPQGYDVYGGYKGADWHEKPTGYFRTVRRNGFWWLVSPEGNPCFYVGVDTVVGTFEKTGVNGREFLFEGLPPTWGEFAPAWGINPTTRAFGFSAANLIRKHGKNWEDATWQEAAGRIRTWGFSGLGKWSGIPDRVKLPSQPVLRRDGVPTLGRLPDVFDPEIRAALRAALEKGIAPHRTNPYVIGWSFMNEHDEIVLKSDIEGILKKPAAVPAKRALVAHALETVYGGDTARMASAWKVADLQATNPQPPAEDIETLRRHFADRYYGYIYKTVKELDPNHLYFGFWIALGWWENEEDWHLMARHCDVIGYDAYDFEFTDERLNRLTQKADKPILCGEFSFPSWYEGKRGYGAYGTSTASDAESGRIYAKWVSDAARNPYCVGVHWFQYRDQPITGRDTKGNGLVLGEHYAFGLVDITDRPKWDMVVPMRETNLQTVGMRLKATRESAAK